MKKQKRSRSGNGTANAQHLYLLWNWPYLHVCKIGISGDVKRRLRTINRTSPGYDFKIIAPVIFGAYYIERGLKNVFKAKWFKVKFEGSGKTERFTALLLPVFLTVIVLAFIVQVVIICTFWLLVLIAAGELFFGIFH